MLIGVDAHNLEGKRTGVGRYLMNLLQEWSRANGRDQAADVNFILYFKDEIPIDLPSSRLFESKLLKVDSTVKFVHWDLPRAAQKDKVDILFCPAYVAPFFYRGKIALTLHDISYEVRPKEFNWLTPADKILLKWVSKKSAQKAAMIFTPSEFSRQEVIRHYNVPADKVKKTLLSVDPALSALPENIGEAAVEVKKRYALGDEFIFYVGSIFTRRHLAEVIQSFSLLAKEKTDCRLLLGGRDYTINKAVSRLIEKKNEELGRQAILRVDFIGDDDLKLLYSACAFFIWLSDYEGFGLPVLEAMSLGAPVITSRGSSLAEVAGQAAILIKDNCSIQEINAGMKRLIENKEFSSELAEAGKRQAKSFSWQICAKETLAALSGQ